MAIGAAAYNFHWSRWNLLAGRNKMVYQIRERLGTTTPVTPIFLKATEVSLQGWKPFYVVYYLYL
jgi:hypothetical protein